MTNRMDHTNCTHDATAAGRRYCRADRKMAIKCLQAAYMAAAVGNDSELIREYEARVEIFSTNWGIELREAYKIVENGPIL